MNFGMQYNSLLAMIVYSHNKRLAKIARALNKPNTITVMKSMSEINRVFSTLDINNVKTLSEIWRFCKKYSQHINTFTIE